MGEGIVETDGSRALCLLLMHFIPYRLASSPAPVSSPPASAIWYLSFMWEEAAVSPPAPLEEDRSGDAIVAAMAGCDAVPDSTMAAAAAAMEAMELLLLLA